MKKIFISVILVSSFFGLSALSAQTALNGAPKSVVTLEIPTENPQKSELKVGNEVISDKPSETVKNVAEKVSDAVKKTGTETKNGAEKVSETAKKADTAIKNDAKKVSETAKKADTTVKNDTQKVSETAKKADTTIKNDAEKVSDTAKKTETEVKSGTDKTKEVLKQTSESVKTGTEKTVDVTKNAAKKTGEQARTVSENARSATETATQKSKEIAQKTVEATKNAADKTAKATKKAARNTIDGTTDFVDSINPNKPVTKESLDASNAVKTLKNEKKEINAAFESRIKDVEAKIKSTENTTNISDVQKRNLIYELNKEKNKLEREKDAYNIKYDEKIEQAKQNKRGNQ